MACSITHAMPCICMQCNVICIPYVRRTELVVINYVDHFRMKDRLAMQTRLLRWSGSKQTTIHVSKLSLHTMSLYNYIYMSIRYTRYISTHQNICHTTMLLLRLSPTTTYLLYTYSSSVRYFPSDHCLSHYSVQEPPRRCHLFISSARIAPRQPPNV